VQSRYSHVTQPSGEERRERGREEVGSEIGEGSGARGRRQGEGREGGDRLN
jgi:hypothetical protein